MLVGNCDYVSGDLRCGQHSLSANDLSLLSVIPGSFCFSASLFLSGCRFEGDLIHQRLYCLLAGLTVNEGLGYKYHSVLDFQVLNLVVQRQAT